jgi:hypothetical protein
MNNLPDSPPKQLPPLRPELVELVAQIRALRKVTKMSGFITNREIGAMLARLSTADLVAVGKALQLHPQDFEHYLRSR